MLPRFSSHERRSTIASWVSGDAIEIIEYYRTPPPPQLERVVSTSLYSVIFTLRLALTGTPRKRVLPVREDAGVLGVQTKHVSG